jgi:FkbM family methyltransferase
MTWWSRARYLGWRLGVGGRRPLRVTMRTGATLLLRPPPSSDLDVAMEVFVVGAYSPPAPLAPAAPRRIVDLGANAGFSLVHFATRYPAARIEAYEPHPRQLGQLRAHVRLNRLEDRVVVRPVAVSNRAADRVALVGDESVARLGPAGGGAAVEVPVVDWLAEAGPDPIDLLKMDIEGSERDILLDPRFGRLDVGAVMVEWHARPDWPSAEADVKGVLAGMGLRTLDGPQGSSHGMSYGIVWAAR